ncbi:MAG TPA: hypothetical protein VKR58_09305 [Aquella sp.]|nr:hypothetical protein [Aquella sp.]
MLKLFNGPVFLISIFVLMLISLEIGRKVRRLSSIKKQIVTTSTLEGPVETVIFALLGLLLAFTFTGAGVRFEAQRQLITIEANAINTAYFRINLLPEDIQPHMRDLFRQYTVLRANSHKNENDNTAIRSMSNASTNFQQQMWNIAITNCKNANLPSECKMLLLPALNNMFDITTTRLVARQNHPPSIIYILLIALSLFSAFLVGYDLPQSSGRNLLYMLSYAMIISLILYIIVEIEVPRYGLITIDEADQIILDLKNNM